MDYIFGDTETTGTEEQDQVIQLAYVVSKDGKKTPMNKLYKPTVPIRYEAMEVHGITPEMVEDAPFLDMSDVLMRGLTSMNVEGNVFVAHNAKFDLDMLAKHGFVNHMQVIDTLRCSKHLLEDAVRHKLGIIYYQYGLYHKMPALAEELGIDLKGMAAHDALYDVLMLILVTRLLMMKAGSPERLIELTQTPVIIKKFTFGKHKDKMVADIAQSDPGYLRWMLGNMQDLDEDMTYTINTLLA